MPGGIPALSAAGNRVSSGRARNSLRSYAAVTFVRRLRKEGAGAARFRRTLGIRVRSPTGPVRPPSSAGAEACASGGATPSPWPKRFMTAHSPAKSGTPLKRRLFNNKRHAHRGTRIVQGHRRREIPDQPHYLDAPKDIGRDARNRILEYIEANPRRWVARRLHARYEEGKLELIGKRPMRMFRKGTETFEIEPGGDLSFLLYFPSALRAVNEYILYIGMKILIAGLGLIGGSFALIARPVEILGVEKSGKRRRSPASSGRPHRDARRGCSAGRPRGAGDAPIRFR